MIVSSASWQNVLASTPARAPLIVADSLTENVQKFIDDSQPDYIYTLGLDLGLNNSYQINHEDVPSLFFPNETKAIYVNDRNKGIIASQLAYYMNLPIIFDKTGWNSSDILDLSGLSEEEIKELYITRIKGNGDNINYLVLANLENESSLLAGRVAGKRKGLIVPVSLTGIEYSGDPYQTNFDNGVFDVWQEIVDTANQLSQEGLFSGSSEYRKGEPLYLGVVGDEYSIPFVYFKDPGLEILNDKDGDRLYTDLIYADLNNDTHFDLSVGRFWGNLTSISLQLERAGLPKDKDAVLIGQYRHRKYQDLQLQAGGMMQAYSAQWALDLAGFNTTRIVENRSDSPLRISLNDMLKMGMFQYGVRGTRGLAGTLSVISMALAIAEIGEMFIYAFLEYDWSEWMNEFNQGDITTPKSLEVLYPDTNLGSPRILGYFGVGDTYWLVPPDNKDEIELMTVPYIRATPLERLNFTNFLYDDHDVSAESEIDRQVLSSGGMSAVSSGIIHDPYTIYYSGLYFESLARGRSVGEAMRVAVNNVVPKNPLSLFDLFFRSGEMPNLYFKTKYQRLLFGDPAYKPVEEGVPDSEYIFRVRPYNSYLADTSIKSDYIIKQRRILVRNADDYLIENGKPYMPVFVREIVLPEGSEVQGVRFSGFYRSYYFIKPLIVPWDEYYENGPVGFSGRYPEEDYWFRTNTLLDGRILVRVYVPAVIYFNNWAKVLSLGSVYIDYESPVEVMIKTNDIRLGLTEKIEVKVSNKGDEKLSGDIWVWVDGKEYSRPVQIESGEAINEVFLFNPKKAGKYQVKALFDSDLPSGPRYSDFRVFKPCQFSFQRLPFWLRRLSWLFCSRCCCDFTEGSSGIPFQKALQWNPR